MKKERILWVIVVLAMIGMLLHKKSVISTIIKEIPGDSIPYEVKVPFDSLIYVTDTVEVDKFIWLHDTTFLPTDTNAILSDFFKMISYDSINLRNDTSITNWVQLKVTQNRLYEITGYSLNNRKTAIIFKEEYPFGIGGIIGVNIAAPIFSYQFKQHQIGLGYNLINPGPILTYQYKFNFK